ncbi:MAG TPA: hypothetical protein VFZ59_16630 [Verrucomicrobiae bacterium]|nr:hypothetical protein [Verrucomicrobiae bacterium]
MNPNLKLSPRTFPARVAELGFTVDLPADWVSHELPKEDVDFSNPTLFMPLAVVTAPHAAIVFGFAARPAYDDGTLHDWAWYHLNHNQLQPRAVGRDVIAGVAAVSGEAVQPSDLGPMVVRFAFLEDGNRLINLTLTAPEIFADSVRDAWFAMLKSFTLKTPRGSRFQIEAHADNTLAAPIPEPWLEEPAQVEPEVSSENGEAPAPAQKKCTLYDFALEADTTSLDPATTINANLRDQGVGLVPNIVSVNDGNRYATVAGGAILAQFDVPYGWHVIDDGKRTLVFEPSGKVQINLNLIPREGRSNEAILDAIEAEMRQDYPHPEFVRLQEGNLQALGARNIADGNQPLEQYHLLYPFRDHSMVLRARVTATPEQATDACNLAELILNSCVFTSEQPHEEAEPVEQPTPGGKPAWWHEALKLEAENKLEAAENAIREGCPYIGFAYSTAEMYRLRMLRLMEVSDKAGALEAFKKSSNFIFFYASMATSGGEGAALSLERDQFRAQLVAEYGSDPEVVRA